MPYRYLWCSVCGHPTVWVEAPVKADSGYYHCVSVELVISRSLAMGIDPRHKPQIKAAPWLQPKESHG